jgi:hypothetical protein
MEGRWTFLSLVVPQLRPLPTRRFDGVGVKPKGEFHDSSSHFAKRMNLKQSLGGAALVLPSERCYPAASATHVKATLENRSKPAI